MAVCPDGFIHAFLHFKDNTLDEVGNLCHLDNGRHHQSVPEYALGSFERLPLEIMNMVLVELDLRTLTDFRRVNQRAMQVVDSIPQYKVIAKHALVTLRGIISIGSGTFISCQDLYDKLSTAQCDSCGDFGGYLYLITCRRVCFLCFTEKTDYLPLLRADVTRKFGLKREQLKGLPAIKTIPGYYTPRPIKLSKQLTLIDFHTARQVAIAIHGSASKLEEEASRIKSKILSNYELRKTRSAEAGDRIPRPPRIDDPFDGGEGNPRRFVAIVRAPFWNRRVGTAEMGFQCTSCKNHDYKRPLHWRRKFTEETYKHHIEESGMIKDGKHDV